VTKRRGTGVAAAIDGSCSACHIELSPMIYQEIKRVTELHVCPSCHRILYYSESASEADARAKAAAEAEADEGKAEEASSES
jgi:predicted  nucleic acid-binding Zn-ribbon protein